MPLLGKQEQSACRAGCSAEVYHAAMSVGCRQAGSGGSNL